MHCPVYIGDEGKPAGKADCRDTHGPSAHPYFLCSVHHSLFRQAIHFEVALRSDAECVSHTIEESEHRGNVHRFGDLRLGPSVIPQLLHIFAGGAVRGLRDLGDVIKQCAFGRAQSGLIKFALSKGFYSFGFCSLNTQEVCMGVQSIRTAIEP